MGLRYNTIKGDIDLRNDEKTAKMAKKSELRERVILKMRRGVELLLARCSATKEA